MVLMNVGKNLDFAVGVGADLQNPLPIRLIAGGHGEQNGMDAELPAKRRDNVGGAVYLNAADTAADFLLIVVHNAQRVIPAVHPLHFLQNASAGLSGPHNQRRLPQFGGNMTVQSGVNILIQQPHSTIAKTASRKASTI